MSISSLAMTAKKVIDAAWENGPSYDLASQAAFALESAQLLQSPETAAELEQLRKQVAELLVERHTTNEALSDAAKQLRANRDQIAELEARLAEYERPVDEDPISFALTPGAEAAVDRLTRMLAPTQALREDPLPHGSRVLPTGGVS
ncbi:hypothetical protein [Streptomyces sp. NPDC047028]|uniref:hypothetical protein n=1 Tax=Streptomyces sp. NPDC047028 TaxID=3155793 RepID=UPI0033D34FAE